MKTKRQRKPVTETAVENTKEIFHWGFAVAPIIASILASLIGKEIHFVIELMFVGAVIIINSSILWLRSRTDKSKELSLFHTFWTNDLPPNQSGDEQTYNVVVAIVEDRETSYFRGDLQNEFKAELDVEELKSLLSRNPILERRILRGKNLDDLVVEVKDRNLYFKPIAVDPPAKEDEEELQEYFKNHLDSALEYATAVVVVRTSNLEEKSWAYDAVNSWAYQHSEVPILFARDPNKTFPKNESADQFLWIPDDSKSLPWRLLQRAKNRGKAWRSQATYNRAMVWNIFYISLMCIYIGAIWIHAKNEELHITMQGMEHAIETERSYRQYTSIKDDSELSVSYWFRHKDKPYIFVTTENPANTKWLGSDTIIGCGFASYPNHVIEWKKGANSVDDTKDAVVHTNYGDEVPEHACTMKKLPTSKITAIVCATFNGTKKSDGNPNPDYTVGVCVFTKNTDNDIFREGRQGSKDFRAFLIDRVIDFNKHYLGLIERNRITSLEDREGPPVP